MGEVYRGHDTRLRRPVALKVLSPGLVRNADAIARFRREAETASALNPPHVLTILDIGEADAPGGSRVHYIAMELIEGQPLRAVLRDADLRRNLRWMQQVASGLAKAHTAGIVHRDLKPDNVMVTAPPLRSVE
jgi:serine/threonine-protein kinase